MTVEGFPRAMVDFDHAAVATTSAAAGRYHNARRACSHRRIDTRVKTDVDPGGMVSTEVGGDWADSRPDEPTLAGERHVGPSPARQLGPRICPCRRRAGRGDKGLD